MLSFGNSDADKACNLECVENLPPVHEFVGPVKIVLMDVPKSVYTNKLWGSAFIALATMLIGATVITILFYTLGFKTPVMTNLHIVLCTFGFQLFLPVAILMQSTLHGPSAFMKPPHRKNQHLFLQLFSVGCSVAGAIIVILLGRGTIENKLKNIHGIAGLVAVGLCVLATFNGPFAYFAGKGCCGKFARGFHIVCGVPAFVASSVCFCIAVFTSKSFKSWAPVPEMIYMLMGFCVIYTVIVIYTPVMKLFNDSN